MNLIQEFQIPSYPLDQFIDHFYYYADYNPNHLIDRFLPDGEVQIIFDFTDQAKYIYDNDSLKEIQSCKNVWFSGFRTEPITIPSGKESEMLVVQFKKGKAFPFLSEPMHHLTNAVVDAELVLRLEILDIRERLLDARTPAIKFAILEERLLACYLNQLAENPFVDFAISKIVASPTQWSIKAIAEKAGYSQKHIIKMFKEHVGVTPKEFLKVIRFQAAIKKIENQQAVQWSDVAYDSGFYDQSHFISDFKKFSGYTPGQYLKIKGHTLNYIPVC